MKFSTPGIAIATAVVSLLAAVRLSRSAASRPPISTSGPDRERNIPWSV
jgi:hypothetical protein